MARIAGVMLPNHKHVVIALTAIQGIGRTRSMKVLDECKIDPTKKAGELSDEEVKQLRTRIEETYRVEGELRRDRTSAIRRLREIGCWRGLRHAKRLPARGQRSKTNSRTVRGNVRRTMGSGRRKLEKT
jgi:small subunit ribosomal protein S13